MSESSTLTPIDLEAACLLLTDCMPLLVLNGAYVTNIDGVICLGLLSTSHFVRKAAICAFGALCRAEVSDAILSKLIETMGNDPSTTLFDVLVMSIQLQRAAVVLCHPSAVESVWRAMEFNDALLAESARCCLRALIFSSNGVAINQLSPLDPILRLDDLLVRSLTSGTSRGTCSAIALFDLRPCDIGSLGERYSKWCCDWIQKLVQWINGEPHNPTEAHLVSTVLSHWQLALDSLQSVFLKHSQLNPMASHLLAKVISVTSTRLQTSLGQHTTILPSLWQLWNKFSKLLISFASISTHIVSDGLISFFRSTLRSIVTPVPTKVSILSTIGVLVVRSVGAYMVDWTFFDSLEADLHASRYAQAWEIRDSVLQVFARVATGCTDVTGALHRELHIPIVFGLKDANESVRSTCIESLTELARNRSIWQAALSAEPSLIYNVFCSLEEQTGSRLAQSRGIAQLLKYEHVVFVLPTTDSHFSSGFASTLDSIAKDDDWDVRSSVVEVIESLLLMDGPSRQRYWSLAGCSALLLSLVRDESRMVRIRIWQLLSDHWRLLKFFTANLPAMELDPSAQISRQLSLLAVDEHYDPDDEVYPLAPGVAENDIDCPF